METCHRKIFNSLTQPPPPPQVRIQKNRHVRRCWQRHRTLPLIQIDYENFPYLLTEEIYNRKGKKTRFSEVEVWYLLWGLSKGKTQAEQLGQRLGDIRPRNVFLN